MTPQQQQLISQLHDIQIPEAVGWWPPSHLLLVVIFGLSGLAMWFLWYQWYRYRMNLYRKEGQQVLQSKLAAAETPQDKILAINEILKQVAMTNFGRHRVASLTGEAWVNFLQETSIYIDQPSDLLDTIKSAYQQEVDPVALQTFQDYAEAWIRGHHK